MTPEERRVLAEAAKRMVSEDVFIRAVETVRSRALEKLVKCSVADVTLLLELQAQVRAIDNLKQQLADFAVAAPRETPTPR